MKTQLEIKNTLQSSENPRNRTSSW